MQVARMLQVVYVSTPDSRNKRIKRPGGCLLQQAHEKILSQCNTHTTTLPISLLLKEGEMRRNEKSWKNTRTLMRRTNETMGSLAPVTRYIHGINFEKNKGPSLTQAH